MSDAESGDVSGQMLGLSDALWVIFGEMFHIDPKLALDDLAFTLQSFLEEAGIRDKGNITEIRNQISERYKEDKQ